MTSTVNFFDLSLANPLWVQFACIHDSFFSRSFTALGRTNICFSGESPIFDNWRWRCFWKLLEPFVKIIWIKLLLLRSVSTGAGCTCRVSLMTFDRAVNPPWLWCLVSHSGAGAIPWYSHMHSNIPPSLTTCSAPRQNPWTSCSMQRRKEETFPINIPLQTASGTAMAPSPGGDQRADPSVLVQHDPSNSSHFASPIQIQRFCQGFCFNLLQNEIQEGNCEKRNIFASWVSIITSAAIFLCVKCVGFFFPFVLFFNKNQHSKVQEFFWDSWWWNLLFSLRTDCPQGIAMSFKKSKVLQCSATLWFKCNTEWLSILLSAEFAESFFAHSLETKHKEQKASKK